jgi:outer membrane protein OmpA-like peptidoglycan-associated protein
MSPIRLALCALLSISAAVGVAAAPEVPLAPGVTFVLAVSNAGPAEKGASLEGILHGDYEMPIAITAVDGKGITQTALIDGLDADGIHRQGVIPRLVRQADLASSHLQILGFYSDDPQIVEGATALGPSLAITRALAKGETVAYSFRNFVRQDAVSGTLSRPSAAPVKFPVLLNGKRVELDAVRATGYMALGGSKRPFEMLILDHPRHPLSLRIAWGSRDAGFPFKPDFAREIVRIDSPREQESLAEELKKDCRVEVPGIYFDFNLATLKPQSRPALQEIAKVLQQAPQRALRIEGHTDNIGTDTYNADLSARRAAAVKDALVRDFRVDGRGLATVGHGESKPIETNDTLAGRARNRRVELVCAQP